MTRSFTRQLISVSSPEHFLDRRCTQIYALSPGHRYKALYITSGRGNPLTDDRKNFRVPCTSVCKRLLNKIWFFQSELTLFLGCSSLGSDAELRCPVVLPSIRLYVYLARVCGLREGFACARAGSLPLKVNSPNKNCGANDVFSFLIGFALWYAHFVIDDFPSSAECAQECLNSQEGRFARV